MILTSRSTVIYVNSEERGKKLTHLLKMEFRSVYAASFVTDLGACCASIRTTQKASRFTFTPSVSSFHLLPSSETSLRWGNLALTSLWYHNLRSSLLSPAFTATTKTQGPQALLRPASTQTALPSPTSTRYVRGSTARPSLSSEWGMKQRTLKRITSTSSSIGTITIIRHR